MSFKRTLYLNIIAVIRGDKVRANKGQNDINIIQMLADISLPEQTRNDFLVILCTEQILPLQR